LSIRYANRQYVAVRDQLRFTLRQPEFQPTEIVGLERISLDDLAEGKSGWSIDEDSGDILIQVSDTEQNELVLKV